MRALLLFVVCVSSSMVGMFDNRFFVPLIERKPLFIDCATSPYIVVQPFLMTAHQSVDPHGDEAGLFDYMYDDDGDKAPYKLQQLDRALVDSGRTRESMFRSDWRGQLSIAPYLMNGSMGAGGLSFQAYTPIGCHAGIGFRGSLMRVRTNLELLPDEGLFEEHFTHGPGDDYELADVQNRIHRKLGLEPALWEKTGFGDCELYGRLFSAREYEYRCRYIEAALSLGFVLPTGGHRDKDNPASIPFGGDGHTGIFLEATLDAIVKYDLRAGILFRFQQRFPHTAVRRAPSLDRRRGWSEPDRFGALEGDFRVKPGPTFAAAPYVTFENIREGLGAELGVSFVKHLEDRWVDERSAPCGIFAAEKMRKESAWGASHVTCSLLYDMRESLHGWDSAPVFALSLDAPVNWLVGERSFRTFGVSLLMEVCF